LSWYLQAKFGLFIHWGPYSAGGAEASWPIMTPDLSEALFGGRRISEADYTALPARFNPQAFDARAWVRLAKRAGMRYLVFTSKHHDGFCMFDAPGTDYKITKTPFGRDICAELAEACAAEGLRLGFYYSPPDMHHPGYRDTRKPVPSNWLGEPSRPAWAGYLDYMESHLRHLLSAYGEVSVIWFDALVNHQKYDPPRFHRLIHELSPKTLINDRLGDGYDFITPEQFIPRQGIPVRTGLPPAANQGGEGLFRVMPTLIKIPWLGGWLRGQLAKYAEGELELTRIPQAENPSPADFQPWETCMTIGRSWGYNPDEHSWKPAERLLRSLVEVVSRGGNYLLNVGPRPDGTFPPEAVERLEAIAAWMERNSAAIYDTSYTPGVPGFNGRMTRAAGHLYLHLLEESHAGQLELPLTEPVIGALLLAEHQPLPYQQAEGRLRLSLPAVWSGPLPHVIDLRLAR